MNKEKSKQGLIMGIIMVIAGVGILVWSLDRIADNNDAETDSEVTVTDNSATDTGDQSIETSQPANEVSLPAEETVEYTHRADLPDVTNGSSILGTNTGGTAAGVAQSVFKDGRYMLYVEFDNLPEPVDDSFYEGWLVQRGDSGPIDFFSTGVVEKDENGIYVDTYTDEVDWNQTHTFYVLTLEPNDDDPAPYNPGHIVEADLLEL